MPDSQVTTVYLPRELHRWTRRRALDMSMASGERVTQSAVIVRALTEYRARLDQAAPALDDRPGISPDSPMPGRSQDKS